MTDIVKRLTAKDNLTSVINTCTCKPGRHPGELADLMKEAADEILRLRAENEKLREALKPFAHNYQNNGLSHSMFMFAMKDLLAAKKALGDTDE